MRPHTDWPGCERFPHRLARTVKPEVSARLRRSRGDAGKLIFPASHVARLPAYAPELNPVEYLWGYWTELANFCAKRQESPMHPPRPPLHPDPRTPSS